MNKIPHSTKGAEALLHAVLPQRDDIKVRPMFGNLAAFVGGNLSVGLYGDDMFVRLSEADRAELLKNKGASLFEPMKGRQMKEYVVLPSHWLSDQGKLKPWVERSLAWSSRLPAKKKR